MHPHLDGIAMLEQHCARLDIVAVCHTHIARTGLMLACKPEEVVGLFDIVVDVKTGHPPIC